MTRRTLGWLLVAVQVVLIVALLLVPHRAPFALSLVIGVVLGLGAVGFGIAAFSTLGSALTPTPVPVDGAGLRTDGPYRLVRHPIYTAVLLLAAGFTIAVGTWWTVAALVVLAAFFIGKSRWEDRLLHERYGTEWEMWANHTGGLLPRL